MLRMDKLRTLDTRLCHVSEVFDRGARGKISVLTDNNGRIYLRQDVAHNLGSEPPSPDFYEISY